jgi:hypothetical protein
MLKFEEKIWIFKNIIYKCSKNKIENRKKQKDKKKKLEEN